MKFTKICSSPYLVSTIFIGIFWGLFLSGINTAWLYSQRGGPSLAVVDMQTLIAQQSQQLAKTTSKTSLNILFDGPPFRLNKIPNQLQKAKDHLKQVLETFAAGHHLILLTKGAVVAGNLPDYTEKISNILENAFLEGEDAHG